MGIIARLTKTGFSMKYNFDNNFFTVENNLDFPVRTVDALLSWHPPTEENKLAVNIVGPNGAGKSLLPLLLTKLDPHTYWIASGNRKRKIMSIFPSFGWGCVGFYRTKCGGADAIHKEEIMESMYRMSNSNLHWLVEGSIVSNTKYTYWNIFKGIGENFPNRKPLFILIDFSYDEYYRRIMDRNGGKELKTKCLNQKCTNLARYYDWYESQAEADKVVTHREHTQGINNMLQNIENVMVKTLGGPCFPDELPLGIGS